MAGTFIVGETKIRPGTYFNIQKVGENQIVAPQMEWWQSSLSLISDHLRRQ